MATCHHPSRVGIRRKSVFGNRRIAYTQVVPCGSCLGCRAEQARQWMVRMMHESEMHDHAWFVTLTYNDEALPENGSLRPKDLSLFLKALRREFGRGISFYGCGEYGESTKRAHYHAVLFGVEFLDRYRDPDPRRDGIWRSETLERLWGRGITEFGTVTYGSCSYVAGYVRKKVGEDGRNTAYVNPLTGEVLVAPFARMSLRPAIGRRWIERYWKDVYPRDFVVVNGVEAKPPRYYDKFMDLEDDKGGTHERRMIMEAVREKRWSEMVEYDKYTLNAKEEIAKARINLHEQRDAV